MTDETSRHLWNNMYGDAVQKLREGFQMPGILMGKIYSENKYMFIF